jgi:hypothetical protein
MDDRQEDSIMVKVYFESTSHAELVAEFANEEIYAECIEALDRLAHANRMIVTESVED